MLDQSIEMRKGELSKEGECCDVVVSSGSEVVVVVEVALQEFLREKGAEETPTQYQVLAAKGSISCYLTQGIYRYILGARLILKWHSIIYIYIRPSGIPVASKLSLPQVSPHLPIVLYFIFDFFAAFTYALGKL